MSSPSGADPSRLDAWLAAFPRGSIRALALRDVSRIETLLERGLDVAASRVVARFSSVPTVESGQRQVLTALGRKLLRRFPIWYPGAGAPLRSKGAIGLEAGVARVLGASPRVAEPWLRAALEHVSRSEVPLHGTLALEVQAEQLALALGDPELVLVIVLESTAAEDAALLRFTELAQWLASCARARVLVVVRPEVLEARGLEAITHGALSLDRSAGSGWDRLLEALARRPDLISGAPRAASEGGLTFEDARLVVEVDAWSTHGNPTAFAEDRRRDYERVLANYAVIRFTVEEIHADVALVVDKLGRVLELRRSVARDDPSGA